MRSILSLMVLCMALGTVDVAPGVEMRSCPGMMPGPICRDYWTSDIIFTGTVTKLVNVPYAEPMSDWHWQRYQKVTATVAVDEVFRGTVGREVTFEMGDCYFEFEEGRKYIIYPAKGQDGKLTYVETGPERGRSKRRVKTSSIFAGSRTNGRAVAYSAMSGTIVSGRHCESLLSLQAPRLNYPESASF